MFFVFEGIDGSGKTTQARLLRDGLGYAGFEAVLVRDPGTTDLGLDIRKIVKQQDQPIGNVAETLLFLAARAELVAKVIQPALADGKVVICDRFDWSTYAYQFSARHDIGDKYHVEMARTHFDSASIMSQCGVFPDQYFYIDTPVSVCRERRRQRELFRDAIEDRGDGYMCRVAAAMDECARYASRVTTQIDGCRGVAETGAQILDRSIELLTRRAGRV